MSNQRRVAGTIDFAASVDLLLDGFATERSTPVKVRRNLTVLSHAVRSYGPFHLGDSLTAVDGAFVISVLNDRDTEGRSFDRIAFHAYVRRLSEACTTALAPDASDVDLQSAAQRFAKGEGASTDKVAKVFRSVRDGATVTLKCGSDEPVHILRPPSSGPRHEDSVDIQIAQMVEQTRIDTDSASYDMDDAAAQDIKPGDYIAVEAAADDEMYSVADAAIPLPEEERSLFGDDAASSSELHDRPRSTEPTGGKR